MRSARLINFNMPIIHYSICSHFRVHVLRNFYFSLQHSRCAVLIPRVFDRFCHQNYEARTGLKSSRCFNPGNSSSVIYRSCSDAPVTDGCEYNVDSSTGRQRWSCIKTCRTDRCNRGSGSARLTPPNMTHLLVLITVIFASCTRRLFAAKF